LAAITKDASLGKHGAATTIGFGLCNEYDGGELGAALALDWDTNTGGNAAAVYGKADPNYAGKGRPVTADSIFKLARQCGWRPAQAQGAVPEPDAAALLLEPALADSLLQLALQTGLPEARIDPAIFPPEKLRAKDPITGEPIEAALHALAWAGIGAGATTPAALLNWVDRQPSKEPPGPPVKAALAALVARLLGLSPVPEPEAAALITRAADLTARLQLLSALGTGTAATNDRKPLMDVIGGLHETTARLQQAAGTTWGAPLTAYAAELLDGLIQVDRPTVATPFPTLNDLLGGGLHGGSCTLWPRPPAAGKQPWQPRSPITRRRRVSRPATSHWKWGGPNYSTMRFPAISA
jgi:hypothetical protein